MLTLRTSTPPAWLAAVVANVDTFLVDHAACERKASATGMAFVVRYPDRPALLEPMIELAREELEHFHRVYELIAARGLQLAPDTPDPYVSALHRWVRTGRDTRLLDRLVLGGVVEARGCERFGLLAEGLPDPDLRSFYADLTRSEARHAGLFVRLAREHFPPDEVRTRLDDLLELEARVIADLEIRPALH